MQHLCIIGSGNVAWHLCQLIKSSQSQYSITVLDRNNKLGFDKKDAIVCINAMHDVPTDADLYILAVRDSDIKDVAKELSYILPSNALLTHTSGTAPLAELDKFQNKACLWPIQSLTKGIEISANQIPWAICSEDEDLLNKIQIFLESLNSPVFPIKETDKAHLHLGAVIINNFTNHMYHLTEEYLQSKNLPVNVLNPLLRYTIDKLENINAKDAQTGPARRNDLNTITSQQNLLLNHEVLEKLYSLLSKSIQKTYQP